MEKRIIIILIIIPLALILTLFLIRLFSETQIDDINPEISCNREIIEKSDILFIIPKFNNNSISENKTWCNDILALNKTLALHGLTHEYHEFKTDRTQEYLQEGINIFKDCFGFEPEIFKPPQLKISPTNKKLIKINNLKLKTYLNQIFHKVYHCQDTGKFSNKFISWF